MITPRQFGSSLRRQRERQNLTLKMLEARTKISASLLAALEKGDCSRWPAGIYSRAWIRGYAEAVGLDPELTVSQFAACFTETAFPDAPPREDAAAEPASLRLGLEPEPGWRVKLGLIRTAFALADLSVITLLTITLWLSGYLSMIGACATSALLIHMAGVAGGQGSAAGAVMHLVRTHRESAAARARERARESTLAEAA